MVQIYNYRFEIPWPLEFKQRNADIWDKQQINRKLAANL